MSRELIRYRAEFKPDVVQLLREFWPSPADSAAQFSWLHEDNPFTESPLVYLALRDGRVVGMRGFYGARWEVAGTGEVFDAPCGNMFVVDSRMRGQRLASYIMKGALADLKARGYRYVFSLSALPIPYSSQLRSGWRQVVNYGQVSRESRQARVRGLMRERLPGLRRGWRWLRHRARAKGGPASRPRNQTFDEFENAVPATLGGGDLRVAQKPDCAMMAEIAQAALAEGRLRHVRTADYFAWRYNAPLVQYCFLTWTRGLERGVLVLESGRGKAGVTRIFDWEATSVEVLRRLIGAVIKFGRFNRLWTWSAGLPEEIVSFLAENGFTPADESMGVPDYEPGMMVKALGGAAPDAPWRIHGVRVDEAESWCLRPVISI